MNTTIEAIELIKELQNTSSNKAKKTIIKTHKDNKDFIYLLETLLDPFVNTHIKSLPDIKFNENGYIHSVDNLREVIELLTSQKARSDKVYNYVVQFLKTCGKEGEIFRGVITKSLKLGVGAKTFNKAIGGAKIFVPDLMKAYDLSKIDPNSVSFPLIMEEKLDGVRLLVSHRKVGITAFTYNGSQVELPELFEEFKKLPYGDYDGEIMATKRQETSGLMTKVIKETATTDDRKKLIFNVFDVITTAPLFERKLDLWRVFRYKKFKYIKLVEHTVVNNWEQVHRAFDKIRAANGEGLMLKVLYSDYEKKRSKSWIKYKGLYSTTLKIIDCEKGQGKYKDMIGNVICQSDDGLFTIPVGSGLTDEIRNMSCEKLKGNLVEVYYTDFYEHNSKMIMDFPRFKEFRLDKDRADLLKEITITKTN